ncbi:MAG: hypothetical protein IKC27_00965 [Kiritimatiellae bacterium]|nr:hypothetical protein [Kiritimatiellia bacterium]
MKECSYEESLILAEEVCAGYIAEKLGLLDHALFYGVNDGIADCAVFDIGQSYTGDLNTFQSPCAHFRAQLDLYSRNRAELQRLIMRCRRFMPIDANHDPDGLLERGNVIQLRLSAEAANPSAIKTVEIELKTDKKKLTVWTVTVTFDLVFLT